MWDVYYWNDFLLYVNGKWIWTLIDDSLVVAVREHARWDHGEEEPRDESGRSFSVSEGDEDGGCCVWVGVSLLCVVCLFVFAFVLKQQCCKQSVLCSSLGLKRLFSAVNAKCNSASKNFG